MRRLMTVLLILSSPAIATPIPLPTHIRDGDTVLLDCGRIYVGELDLSNRRGVTVTTRGTCGRATITPAQLVLGWKNNVRDPRLWSRDHKYRAWSR